MASRPLNVIIVGSGLAGLTAACILKEKHNVTIYERGSQDVATGGQGIMMAANGAKILRSINFDANRAGGVDILALRTFDKDNNSTSKDIGIDISAEFGANYMAMKRSDFRDELLRLATADPNPAKIVFNKNVKILDPQGVIELEDGTSVSADVIVVADGVHSRLRKFIVGDGHQARKTGLTCYRVVVSIDDAKEALGNEALPSWLTTPATSMIHAGDGTARVIGAYPVRQSHLYNMSCIVKTDETSTPIENSWHASANIAQMLDNFQDFDAITLKVLSTAKEVKAWELQDLEPLPFWSKGRAILIGDAAHAMTPMQGQGANMAIEDAEAFRILTDSDSVEETLQKIQTIRRARVLEVLAETRKSHSTVGLAERVVKNLKFNCGYDGIVAAMARSEEA